MVPQRKSLPQSAVPFHDAPSGILSNSEYRVLIRENESHIFIENYVILSENLLISMDRPRHLFNIQLDIV